MKALQAAGMTAYQTSFTEQAVRWTEAACGDCRCCGDAAHSVSFMDEPTAMLDPNGRKEVLDTVHELNRQENVTVVLITHYMEEVTSMPIVLYVMDDGHSCHGGDTKKKFSRR